MRRSPEEACGQFLTDRAIFDLPQSNRDACIIRPKCQCCVVLLRKKMSLSLLTHPGISCPCTGPPILSPVEGLP